jgi:hypothetical protein
VKRQIRFAELIEQSGKPKTHALWTEPKQDRELMSAVKAHRVLTVIQKPTGNAKDFGLIGFQPQKFASYLIFPRPLRADEKVRVVGLHYDQIAEPAVKRSERFTPSKPAPVKPPKSKEKRFMVIFRRVASEEVKVEVSAANQSEAKAKSLRSTPPFSLEHAEIKTEVDSVKELED